MPDQPLLSAVIPTLETISSLSPRLRLPVRTARELVITKAWVPENTPAERVYRMFGQDPQLPGLAILRNQSPVGLVFRSTLVERFSYRFSHELFGPKPITSFMDTSPVTVEVSSDIDEIGRRFQVDLSPRTMDDGFLIVDKGCFVGVGTWQALMKCLSGRREEIFSYMAHHDPLTGLPNRILFMSELERELGQGGRGGIFYIDLDRFKKVNDRFGHLEGDRLLNEFSDRLIRSARPEDLVARLGGDEFGVLVRGLVHPPDANLWISQFLGNIKAPYNIAGQPYEISASIGHCLYPEASMDLETILRQADTRMYRDKRQRRGRDGSEEEAPGKKGETAGEWPGRLQIGLAVLDQEGKRVAQNDFWEPDAKTDDPLPEASPELGCLDYAPREILSFPVAGGGFYRVVANGPMIQGFRRSPCDSLDKLTSLQDRTSFYCCFSQEVSEQLTRNEGYLLLLVMDLDRFQTINDISGHTTGDRVLKEVSNRLLALVRKNDIVARLGGDEFALLFAGVSSRKAAEKMAEEIMHAVSMPYQIEGQEFFLTSSIGATIMPEDGHDFETLISNADLALSQAKERGRFQVQFFNAKDRLQQTARYSMEKRLYKALERNEFCLHYQPIVDMVTGRTKGAEALIRWVSEDGQMVPPDQFIPLAEANGMIIPIGEWVCRTAMEELSRWRKEGLDHLQIGINLSARQLQEPDFLVRFLDILERSGEDPSKVMIEMTETVLMQKAQSSIEIMGSLKALDLRIAIDDFGTGYSSLGYLRRFPVDVLKIDRTFIRHISLMGEDAEIVRLITFLARALRLEVCAEGVETDLEFSFLRDLEVGSYQGYRASPPLPSGEFIRWVRNGMTHLPVEVVPKSQEPNPSID